MISAAPLISATMPLMSAAMEDSTSLPSFVTVITDHGKLDKSVLAREERKTAGKKRTRASARKEIAIIIVDHHLDLALALSDTTVALERGLVIHQGPSKALRQDLDLRRKVLWL